MSVSSLIQQYGKSCVLRRPTFGKTTAGGVKIASETTSTITMLIQAGGGGKGVRYGAESAQYGVTGYCYGGTDIKQQDVITYSSRRYVVQSVRTPDERATSDSLQFVVVGLTETREE